VDIFFTTISLIEDDDDDFYNTHTHTYTHKTHSFVSHNSIFNFIDLFRAPATSPTVSSLKGIRQNTSIYNNVEKAHKKLITQRYYSTQMIET